MTRLDIFEYAEQHRECSERIKEYEIDGKKYLVHSHFIGNKDIDTVIRNAAFTRAMTEVLAEKTA